MILWFFDFWLFFQNPPDYQQPFPVNLLAIETFQNRPIIVPGFWILDSALPRISRPPTHLLQQTIATSNNIMASAKPLTMLVARSRPTARLTSSARTFNPPAAYVAAFSTTYLRAYATPSGPPPAGFRLPKPERWDESKESSLDKAGKYFLLTEMARGMYVALEQFFRPP